VTGPEADNRLMHPHHRHLRHAVVPTALILTVFVSSCGGDDKLSEAEYLKQGNAICEKQLSEIDAAGAAISGGQEPTPAQFDQFANDVLIPKVRAQIDGLAKLEPPSELEDDVDAMLEASRADLAQMEADIKADSAAFMASEDDPFADANAKANAIGLTVCGNP
jgi:hypothetical protein